MNSKMMMSDGYRCLDDCCCEDLYSEGSSGRISIW